jgi:hypothetical protein
MNSEAPTKRQRMSRATWIGLGLSVGLAGALAWLLGWGPDPAPPVPQRASVPLSDLYPEWVRLSGGAMPLPPMLNADGGANFAQAEQVPWLLWRARQQGSPLHRLMRNMGPRLPVAIQSRLPTALDPAVTRIWIGTDLRIGLNNRGLNYSDILREVLRLPQESQQRLLGVLRPMGLKLNSVPSELGDETYKLLLQLAREGYPAIRVFAGVELLEGYEWPLGGVGEELQSVLLQLARERAGELGDWNRLIRISVALPTASVAYDPILEELGNHPDPTVALLARVALNLRTHPSELAPFIRTEFDGSDFVRQKLLLNLLALVNPKQLSQLPSDVATEFVRVLAKERLAAAIAEPSPTLAILDLDYHLWQKSSPAAAAHLLLAMGTNAVTVAPLMVEALDAARSVHRDAAMSLAAALAGLSHHVAIPVDERILHAVQDPFLTEPMLGVIGLGGRTNAHAFTAVVPFLRSDVSGLRRAAFEAVLRIHAPDAELWVHVRESLQDSVRQDLALRAVPQFGAQAREILPRLREIASDPSEARGMAELRRLATEAIRAVEGNPAASR